MFFFRKKRKEQNNELDESFGKVLSEISIIDEQTNPKKIEHYILESCEHIINMAKEVDASQNQYNLLTEHLQDVETIMSISPEKKNSLKEIADNVYKLTKRKKNYKEGEKRLKDETFILLQEHENSVVEDIKRMEENERYQAKIESDIRSLESEKSRMEMDKDDLYSLINKLRIASVAIFSFIICLICAWLVIPKNISQGVRLGFLIAIFLGVLASFIIFIFVGNKRNEYKKYVKNLNQTIGLLNIARMKFVNVTKALSFEKEIYDVSSSKELSYLWEQYMLTLKEQEAYRKNNIDLTYYVDRLYKIYKELNLKFERKWVEQVSLMIDEDKMISLRIKLLERRALINEQIDTTINQIKEERAEIDRLMNEYDFYLPEVLEIINNVDKISANYRRTYMKNR